MTSTNFSGEESSMYYYHTEYYALQRSNYAV